MIRMRKQQKKTTDITAPVYMMNRELSWLKFNNRSKNSLTSIGTPLKKSLFCIKQYNIKCFYLF